METLTEQHRIGPEIFYFFKVSRRKAQKWKKKRLKNFRELTFVLYTQFLYRRTNRSIAPSRISKLGKWGRKSLPTKKHINTQSSTARSKSYVKGKFGIANSRVKYSRRTFKRTKIKLTSPGGGPGMSTSRSSPVQSCIS